MIHKCFSCFRDRTCWQNLQGNAPLSGILVHPPAQGFPLQLVIFQNKYCTFNHIVSPASNVINYCSKITTKSKTNFKIVVVGVLNGYKLCRNDTKISSIYDKIYTVHDRFFTNTMRKIVRMLQYLRIERVEKGFK